MSERKRKRAQRDGYDLMGRKLSPDARPIMFSGEVVGWSDDDAAGPRKIGLDDGPRDPVTCNQLLPNGKRCRRTVVTVYAPGAGQIQAVTHDDGWYVWGDVAQVPATHDFTCECGATRDVPLKEIAGTLLR